MIKVLVVMNDGNWGGVASSIFPLFVNPGDIRFHVVTGSDGLLTKKLRLLKLPVDVVDFTRPHFDLCVLGQLIEIIRKNDIQLVHAHHPRAYLRSRIAAMLSGVPHISTPHVSFLDEIEVSPVHWWRSKYMYLRERLTSKLDRATVALTPINMHRLIEQGMCPDRMRIIPNGVDLVQFKPQVNPVLKTEIGWHCQDPVVGAVGRLAPEKGFVDLVKAFAQMQQIDGNGRTVRLLLVGDGPERKALEEQVKTMALDDKVYFSGHQNDVRPFIAAMDIVAFTSFRETLPIALLESMAMEKVILAVDLPIFEDIICENCGLLVSREKLSVVMSDIIKNISQLKSMGRKARERVSLHYDLRKNSQTIRNLYQEFVKVQ